MVMVRICGITRKVNSLVAEPDTLSITRMVKVDDPTMVGVPDMTPCARVSPGGSDPLAKNQLYGGVPPDALSPCEYAAPTEPGGKPVVVMLRTGALIARDRVALADVDMLSVTLRVKLEEPAPTGVPLIIPPERLNPAGSDPLERDQV